MLKNNRLFYDLIFIKSNFERLKEMKGKGMLLKYSLGLFKEAHAIIFDTSGEFSVELQNKCNHILKRNPDRIRQYHKSRLSQ